MKETGCANDMEEKLLADERFQLDRAALDELLDIRKFVGMAPMQARDYINNCVRPMLDANAAELTKDGKGEVTC